MLYRVGLNEIQEGRDAGRMRTDLGRIGMTLVRFGIDVESDLGTPLV